MTTQKQVVHPRLGKGVLISTSNGGSTWDVLFESGIRFRLPSVQFETKFAPPPPRQVVPLRESIYTSLPLDEAGLSPFQARQTIETLRMGIVPMSEVEKLTIGLKVERTTIDRALSQTASDGGAVMAIIGDYGYGKSHFVELSAQRALNAGFLVASASLDLKEMPPSKPHEIYKGLISALRYPQTDSRGLGLLIQQALGNPEALHEFLHEAGHDPRICPISAVLSRLKDEHHTEIHTLLIAWLSGQPVPAGTASKMPKLYRSGENARLFTYMLLRLSRLAKLLGYSGLAVLIDESEHYSLLRANMRERADSFFKAMIYGAVSDNGDRIDEATIPQRLGAPYPLEFDQPPHLMFMFALTDSDDRLPVGEWLSQKQTVRLEDSYIQEDIHEFMKTLLRYHTSAYRYPFTDMRADDYNHLISEGARLLTLQLKQHNMNLREVIRTAVHLCDLLFLHLDYSGAQAITELRKGLGL
jgi:hypothetical protein